MRTEKQKMEQRYASITRYITNAKKEQQKLRPINGTYSEQQQEFYRRWQSFIDAREVELAELKQRASLMQPSH